VGLGQQGVEFTDDGDAGGAALQAAVQERQRLVRPPQVEEGPAEVEEDEGVVGVLGVVEAQQAQVALQLPAAQAGVAVAGVPEDDVGEAEVGLAADEGGQDLLLDAVLPAVLRPVAEQPHMAHVGGLLARDRGRGARGHDVGRVLLAEAGEQGM
jgi:hypothetical protein